MISGGIVEAFVGDKITYTGGAAITAGQVVGFTAARTVGPAGNGSTLVAGVALQSYDGTASTGSKLAVASAGVFYLTASGTIAFGARITAAAAGAVRAYVPGTDDAALVIGFALEAATNGQSKRFKVRI